MSSCCRVAAIDCGTNSLRLLIADTDAQAGVLHDVERRTRIVRLGAGVDATGTIDAEAITRALAVIEEYADCCRAAGVRRIRCVTTSATRQAANRSQFVAAVRAALGVAPDVISGAEEAALSFLGATRQLAARFPPPYLVVDIGGGSTEVVLGRDQVQAAISVDLGSVRLTERLLSGDPPTPQQIDAATTQVQECLDRIAETVDLASARTLIGVAGSVITVTAHALRLQGEDLAAVDGVELDVATVRSACADLLGAARADRAALPYVQPGREDVIGAGALIWSLLVARVAAAAGLDRVLTSGRDLLDGVAWSLA